MLGRTDYFGVQSFVAATTYTGGTHFNEQIIIEKYSDHREGRILVTAYSCSDRVALCMSDCPNVLDITTTNVVLYVIRSSFARWLQST